MRAGGGKIGSPTFFLISRDNLFFFFVTFPSFPINCPGDVFSSFPLTPPLFFMVDMLISHSHTHQAFSNFYFLISLLQQ